MKISIMADEVSDDFDTALELIKMWGVEAVEVRFAGGRRYPDVSDYWKVRVPQLIKEYQLEVSSISPGLFKFRYPSEHEHIYHSRRGDAQEFTLRQQTEQKVDFHLNTVLPAAIEAAKMLNCKMVGGFGFQHQELGPVPEGGIQVLRRAGDLCQAAGLIFTVELEDWPDRTAELMRRVNHPAVWVNWDPANGYRAGHDHPFPEGYEHLRPYIRHVHFKDVTYAPDGEPLLMDESNTYVSDGKRVFALDGLIDWKGAIAALKADGYDGYIVVEPHYRPQVHATMYSLEKLRRILAEV